MRLYFQIRRLAFALIVGVCTSSVSVAKEPQLILNSAIASAHPDATRAGYEILKKGGNAFDAAVAVSAALAVVEPFSSGIGGGGFFLLHRASDSKEIMLDAREAAPLHAHANMFLDETGKPILKSSLDGAKASAIPGLPSALVLLSEKYGSLRLTTTLAPAIRLARQGFVVDARYLCMVRDQFDRLQKDKVGARIFLDRERLPEKGFRLRQSNLARTLEAVARSGNAGFYRGSVAKELVAAVQKERGIWTQDDLRNYKVIEREPIRFEYRGAKITSASLPSSGGIVLAESLNILERLPLDTANRDHYIVEAMRRAYQDRANYLGDPDFVGVPVEKLMSKGYARERSKTILVDRATPSSDLDSIGRKKKARTLRIFLS